MDEDYMTIDARLREARRLRAEAAGELLAAGWQGVFRFAAAVRSRAGRVLASLTARINEALHHRRPAHR